MLPKMHAPMQFCWESLKKIRRNAIFKCLNMHIVSHLVGAGPDSLVKREIKPRQWSFMNGPKNTCSILASQILIVPPRFRGVVMGQQQGTSRLRNCLSDINSLRCATKICNSCSKRRLCETG